MFSGDIETEHCPEITAIIINDGNVSKDHHA